MNLRLGSHESGGDSFEAVYRDACVSNPDDISLHFSSLPSLRFVHILL